MYVVFGMFLLFLAEWGSLRRLVGDIYEKY